MKINCLVGGVIGEEAPLKAIEDGALTIYG
jgi:hypothetical protein